MPLSPQRCEDLATEIEELEEEYITLQEEVEEEQDYLDELEQARSESEAEADLEEKIDEFIDLMAEKMNVQDVLRPLQEERDFLTEKIEQLEDGYAELEQTNTQACDAVTDIENELDDLDDDIRKYDEIHRDIVYELERARSPQERHELEQEKKYVEEKRNEATERYRKLRDEALPKAKYDCGWTGEKMDEVEQQINEAELRKAEVEQEIELLESYLVDIDAEMAALFDLIETLREILERVISWFTDQPVTLEEKKERLQEVESLLFQQKAEYESHCGIYE